MQKTSWAVLALALLARTGYGQALQEIEYTSSADKTRQRAMFFAPESEEAVPMIVALHTWSGDYRQQGHKAIAQWCMKNGWAFLHPDFRGPNRRPEATGSELVVKDIASAVEHVKKTAKIDAASVYLVGTSGGGYTSLLMAGRTPGIWAGVSAWVPISDLKAWHAECKKANRRYYREIEMSCGGAPGTSDEVDAQYKSRSPLTWLANARGLHLHINAGIRDGHDGSVPISHSLLAFNVVACEKDRIPQEDIDFFVKKAQVPPRLQANIEDASYGSTRPLFRRTSGKVTITLFDGGHQLVPDAAIAWIQALHEKRKRERQTPTR